VKSRHLTPLILEALADTPVVFVQGPRQSGKTTLVQGLREQGHHADYFTMDDAVGWPGFSRHDWHREPIQVEGSVMHNPQPFVRRGTGQSVI
jgi:tRNA A37 threonylcarbamoyladenosine biosynthesis protein TsaE